MLSVSAFFKLPLSSQVWRVKKGKRERLPETNPPLLGVCYFICCMGEGGGRQRVGGGGGQTEGLVGGGGGGERERAQRWVGGGRGRFYLCFVLYYAQ